MSEKEKSTLVKEEIANGECEHYNANKEMERLKTDFGRDYSYNEKHLLRNIISDYEKNEK